MGMRPVLVVDKAGQPIEGVPVGWVRINRLKNKPNSGTLNFRKLVKTNAVGIGVVRHIRDVSVFNPGLTEVLLGPAVLLRSRPDVKLDLAHLPDEPIRIVMPPMGFLQVQVLDFEGRPNEQAEEVRFGD